MVEKDKDLWHRIRIEKKGVGMKILWFVALMAIFITSIANADESKHTAAESIEQAWLSSPEYRQFEKFGGEKSQEALSIKEKTVRKIALQRLEPFINGFDERIRDRSREKINAYPATILVILSSLYEKAIPLIKDRSQRNMNLFNSMVITYIDQVYNGTGKAEDSGKLLIKRLPELKETEFEKLLLEIGKRTDSIVINMTKISEWEKIIKKLQALP